MTTLSASPENPDDRRPRSRRRRPRRPVSVVGVFGELLITAGVLVLLFLAWQVWWNSAVLSSQQASAAQQQSEKWLQQGTDQPTPTATTPEGKVKPADTGFPPVIDPVSKAEPFAVMYVPRFGKDWKRIVRESVDVQAVLNSYDAGVGHYPDTQMPGAVGNFAIAAHDTGYGNSFLDVSKLRVGDAIYFQTKDGWYTYTFRNFEYVQPDAVTVLLPVPRETKVEPQNRLVTLTTCNPPYHAQERIAAYGVFKAWSPPNEIPKAIASIVKQGG